MCRDFFSDRARRFNVTSAECVLLSLVSVHCALMSLVVHVS